MPRGNTELPGYEFIEITCRLIISLVVGCWIIKMPVKGLTRPKVNAKISKNYLEELAVFFFIFISIFIPLLKHVLFWYHAILGAQLAGFLHHYPSLESRFLQVVFLNRIVVIFYSWSNSGTLCVLIKTNQQFQRNKYNSCKKKPCLTTVYFCTASFAKPL